MFSAPITALILVASLISPVAPAVTIDGSQTQYVAKGDELLLTCQYNASPPVSEVQWRKNGTVVLATNATVEIGDSRVTVPFYNGSHIQLSINTTTPQDAGNYSCHVTNNLGNSSDTTVIVIEGAIQASTSSSPTTPAVSSSSASNSVSTSIKATTSEGTSKTPSPSSTPATPTTPKASVTVTPTTSPPEKTCARVGVVIETEWNETFKNESSKSYIETSNKFVLALTKLYDKNHEEVAVSNVTFKEKDEKVFAEGKLCLKGDADDFIEDVFVKKVDTEKLSEDLEVKKGSATFLAIGVTFSEWEAKDGECKKCDEGAAGPFVIEGTCEADKGYSCKGLKNTKESDDCVKYCPSSSATITVSTLILAIGIFLSFRFQ